MSHTSLRIPYSEGHARPLLIAIALGSLLVAAHAQTSVLIGSTTVAPNRDFNSSGSAEAFQATAGSSGALASLSVYVDTSSTATGLVAGVYSDSAGNPGSLLTMGTLTAPVSAAWNVVPVQAASITAGTKYWLAVLGTGGTLRFRDQSSGTCASQSNRTTGLTALPATWTPGSNYRDCPVSVYGSGSGTVASPVLSVSTNSLGFSMTIGGAQPSAGSIQVTNSGGSSLSFGAASDAAWLSVTPTSASAPATLQISADGTGLAVGTYTGHVTVTASGVQGSPQTITVTFNIAQSVVQSQPGDWLQVHHDSMRTGFASDETTLSPSNVGTLALSWSAALDGQITAQPLFVGGVNVGGATRDVVISATSGNSVYALDAASGSVLWKRNFGTQPASCVLSGGFGVTGTPVIDRANQRVYAVSSAGVFYALSLATGAIVGQTPPIILNPDTNNVWGGLNQNGNFVYFATGSNGCDSQPWQGTTYKVNVSNSTPTLVLSSVVVPSLASTNDAGGGIWGYGGVAVDPTSGNVYVTAAADVNESTTPYANRLIAYDANLNVLGSYLPSDPATYPCDAAPCDLDFGSTPVVFTPPNCSQMVAGGKKNGNIYLFKTADLIASGQPTQILTINAYNDSLGSGGAADPTYWSKGNMLFDGTAGPGANGFSGGLVAMKVTNSCTLANAWSQPLGGGDDPNSSVTVANGVAFIGVGQTGQVLAFDATSGTLLWQSPTGLGNTFAAPMVAKGTVFAGSWNGFAATAGGTLRAYTLSQSNLPPTLTVSPTALTFNATAGGANPSNQTVSIGNSGIGSLTFSASSDATWLTVTPTSGSVPQSITVSANTAGLSAGTLTGHITITANGALQSPQTVTVTLNLSSGTGGGGGSGVLLGDQVIETQVDYNSAGTAEAFQATATATGTTTSMTFYLDATSSATQVAVGVYSDAGGHPGTLLTQASTSAPASGAWNTLSVPSASLTLGTNYWIAILGSNGTVRFNDKSRGCSSETSLSTTLTALPATWSTGRTYTDCPISAYVSH
jgi:outer membrane protein assembly factor BamB